MNDSHPVDVQPGAADLLTPGQVALRFGVTPKTVSRWDGAGLLPAQRTSGGHRRFRADDVRALEAALGAFVTDREGVGER